jgi:flavin reductase (DIM6/NTAB) family NADH-FMN oxidoreductase RutF
MTKKNFISVDPDHSTLIEVHNLLLGGVTPRPIALVSTISAGGVRNLAPFSFFNAFGANPPYVAFSPANSGRDGSVKDTLRNVKEIAECVIHAVSHDIMEQMSLSSSAFGPDIDEFEKAGFTALPSEKVRPSRVAESPFHMECLVEQIIPLGGTSGSGNLVLCRVVQFHVAEDVRVEGVIDPDRIDLIGRNSANYYTRASGEAIFELKKPIGVGMGIDALPEHIRHSHNFSGNDLGMLGGLVSMPDPHSLKTLLQEPVAAVDPSYLKRFKQSVALASSNPQAAIAGMEQAAREALEDHEAEMALQMLLCIPLI